MTVEDIRNILYGLPDDMEVFVGERLTEESYGLVNEAKIVTMDYFNDSELDYPVQIVVFSEE